MDVKNVMKDKVLVISGNSIRTIQEMDTEKKYFVTNNKQVQVSSDAMILSNKKGVRMRMVNLRMWIMCEE